MNILICLMANQWWLFHQYPYYLREISLCLVAQLAFSYETGYKKCYLEGRKMFFYIAFIIPLAATILSFSVALFKLPF